MKTLQEKCSFILRLGMTVAVMLVTQQALAAGTTAGTDIDNMATVDYFVGGTPQTEIESSPTGNSTPGANGTITTFEVDNRVDFTLTQVGGVHTIVAPGVDDAFVEFLLSNDGNSEMDFRLVVTQLSAPGTVFGDDDTDVDMGNIRIVVGNGGGAPVLGADLDYVDEIAEDDTVTIYVYGDAGLALVDGDFANLNLEATAAAADPLPNPPGLGADLVDGAGAADDPALVDIVFANGMGGGPGVGDGTEDDDHGFEIQSAELEITKVATVIWDPFNELVNPKAIPGAIVEYVVTVDNTGAIDALNVVITDTLDGNVTMETAIADYAGEDVWIRTDDNTVVVAPCNVLANPDGCTLTGADLTVGDIVDLQITVDAGTFATFSYRVMINN